MGELHRHGVDRREGLVGGDLFDFQFHDEQVLGIAIGLSICTTLLNDTQQQLALQYICDSQRSIGEITYLLGYSEPASFTRAFRRWTGKSPLQFRGHRRAPHPVWQRV